MGRAVAETPQVYRVEAPDGTTHSVPVVEVPGRALFEASFDGATHRAAVPETAVARIALFFGWPIRAILPPGRATEAEQRANLDLLTGAMHDTLALEKRLRGYQLRAVARVLAGEDVDPGPEDGADADYVSAMAAARAVAGAWRDAAPSDAEIEAHHAAGGAWVLLLDDGAMTLERSSRSLVRYLRDKGLVRRCLALDSELRIAQVKASREPA